MTERGDRREPDGSPDGIGRAEQGDAAGEREPPGEDAGGELGLNELRERAATGEEFGRGEPQSESEPKRAPLTWPARSRGHPLTFEAIVTAHGASTRLDYAIDVK